MVEVEDLQAGKVVEATVDAPAAGGQDKLELDLIIMATEILGG
jgi:hypothetical protein